MISVREARDGRRAIDSAGNDDPGCPPAGAAFMSAEMALEIWNWRLVLDFFHFEQPGWK
jgi:hypothetical protein